jgi:hypothetical protein
VTDLLTHRPFGIPQFVFFFEQMTCLERTGSIDEAIDVGRNALAVSAKETQTRRDEWLARVGRTADNIEAAQSKIADPVLNDLNFLNKLCRSMIYAVAEAPSARYSAMSMDARLAVLNGTVVPLCKQVLHK